MQFGVCLFVFVYGAWNTDKNFTYVANALYCSVSSLLPKFIPKGMVFFCHRATLVLKRLVIFKWSGWIYLKLIILQFPGTVSTLRKKNMQAENSYTSAAKWGSPLRKLIFCLPTEVIHWCKCTLTVVLAGGNANFRGANWTGNLTDFLYNFC